VGDPWFIGGRIEGINMPEHFDFRSVRLTPWDVRAQFEKLGWRRVLAFQTADFIHRAQHELILQAVRAERTNLLIQPLAWLSQRADRSHYTRIRSIQHILSYFPRNTVRMALLPYYPRFTDGRERYLRAIIARNYGCTHLLMDEDEEWDGQESTSLKTEADDLIFRELGVKIIPFRRFILVEELDAHVPVDEVETGMRVRSISRADMLDRLAEGRDIPEWFTFPEVTRELKRAVPPRRKQGFTVFFTGLSGSGKSTIAKILLVKFLEMAGRPVTLLDGDIVRKNLSSELGFSKEHRDVNIRRIVFVASEITKNGGIAICAPIAPYDQTRKAVREMIGRYGGFVLVHVSTPVEECERRDRKGLYAKARAGIIKGFTGVSDPYEPPADAEVVIDTTELKPDSAAQEIILHLEQQGYIGVNND